MVGWYLDIPTIIQIETRFVPMQFNTALGFVLMGLAILAIRPQPKITFYLGIIIIFFGFLTLLQYIFQLNLGIDQLFFKHYITVETSHPGRMAPNTALNFTLSGIALLFIAQSKRRNQLLFASFLGALTMGLGTVALLGYASHIETAYGWGKLTSMAIHTSSGFIAAGLALILEAQYLDRKKYGQLPSIFLPLTLGILGLTMTISLWQALHATPIFHGIEPEDVYIKQWIGIGILLLGGSLTIVLAIAVWLAQRFYEQVKALELAQRKILVLNQKLKQLSYLDGLTGIANRRFFDITLEKEWARAYRYQYPLALMIIDIDYFKKYNDFYGHQAGDKCIRKVAYKLKRTARRKTDLAARYGGEEFVLLMTNIDPLHAQEIAENLRQTILDLNIPHAASPIHHLLTISVGCNVLIPTNGLTPDQFILDADKALYRAKNIGRNRVMLCQLES